MPKICYVKKRFHPKSLAVIEQAEAICLEYVEQGYSLTLRQLYYQFVARGLIKDNTIKEYKNLGSIINDARLAGLLDWNYIEDRTRYLSYIPYWDKLKSGLTDRAEDFRYDFWETQKVRIEVWVEKEALVGVVERASFKYRVPYFACRGYASQSEVWRAGQRYIEYNNKNIPVIILHLGDHDPSGIDMTRDNDDRLQMFSEHGNVKVIRLALNMNQVKRYKPPSNPAKMTDQRVGKYIKKFGKKSWELDALDPKVIDALISKTIERYINWKAWRKMERRENKARKRLAKLAKNWKTEFRI